MGAALVRQATAQEHEVVLISREQWDMEQSPEQGEALVLQVKPDLVINPAAYTNVDGAEDDEASAFKVNADAPRALAKGSKQLDIPIFHVSTEYVFDGTKEEPYVETDQTNPINAYGRTKLAGELAIQEETKKHIILRTSWVFTKNGKNFLNTILSAKESDELKVVNDQFGGPTSAECIAEVLLRLTTEHKEQWGIYHYSGQPFVSWYEYAKYIIEQKCEKKLDGDEIQIKPCRSREYETKVIRPQNSKINSTKINELLCQIKSNWRDEVKIIITGIKNEK